MNATISYLPVAKHASFNGQRLAEARQFIGMPITELATRVGVTRQAISQFEGGKAQPGPELLSKLAVELDQPILFFANQRRADDVSAGTTYFRSFRSATARIRTSCRVLKQWLIDVHESLKPYVNFPEVRCEEVLRPSYSPSDLELVAAQCRKSWGMRDGPIANLVALLEANGIVVVRADLGSRKIDAFSFWHKDQPFIVLGNDKRSAVRSRFDAAHELGHLVLHRNILESNLEDPEILARIEKEADRFAAAFLLPGTSFPKEIYAVRLKFFLQLKPRWLTSVASMVTRCQQLGLLSDDQTLSLRKQISAQGMRMREPMDDDIPQEQPHLLADAIRLIANASSSMLVNWAEGVGLRTGVIEALSGVSKGTLACSSVVAPVVSLRANYVAG